MKISAVQTFEEIQNKLHDCKDLKSRTMQFFDTYVTLCYIAPISNNLMLNQTIATPILEYQFAPEDDILSTLKNHVLSNNEVTEFNNLDQAIEKLLEGHCLILVDNADVILGCDIELITVRAVSEPPTSVVIKGPREGFNESLKFNLGLIRRRVKSDDLVVTTVEIDDETYEEIVRVSFVSEKLNSE